MGAEIIRLPSSYPAWWHTDGRNVTFYRENTRRRHVHLRGAVYGKRVWVLIEASQQPGLYFVQWSLGPDNAGSFDLVQQEFDRAFKSMSGFGGNPAFARRYDPVPDASCEGAFIRKGPYFTIVDEKGDVRFPIFLDSSLVDKIREIVDA